MYSALRYIRSGTVKHFPNVSVRVPNEKILAFYDPYISKCCLRPLYDEYGNVYIVVDMELKGLIREALIKMILGFDIALEIEEE